MITDVLFPNVEPLLRIQFVLLPVNLPVCPDQSFTAGHCGLMTAREQWWFMF